MFFLFASLLLQMGFLVAFNNELALGLSALAFVLGRPVLSGVAVTWWVWVPPVIQRFIDVKIFGFLATFVASMVVKLNRRWRIGVSQNLTVLAVSILVVTTGLLAMDSVVILVLLALPFSFALALLVFLVPLVVIVNFIFFWRMGLSVFFWCVGVRDPFASDQTLARVGRLLIRKGGGFLEERLMGLTAFTEAALFAPLEFVRGLGQPLFTPRSFRPKETHLFSKNRLAWSVSLFMFKFFDLEALCWIVVGTAVAGMTWAAYVMSGFFGVSTVFDILFPTLYVFQEELSSTTLLGFSRGFQWFVASVLERSVAEFQGFDPMGVPLLVHDKDSFFAASRKTRRDIMVSYLSVIAAPRVVFFLLLFTFLGLWRLFLGSTRMFRDRIGAFFLHLISSFMWATLPFIVPDNWIDFFDLGLATVAPMWAPFLEALWTWVYGLARLSYPVLGAVLLSASTEPQYDNSAGDDSKPKLSNVFASATLALTRRSVLKFTERLNQIRLPEFVSSCYDPPTINSITKAYRLLADVGFPVNEDFLSELTAGAQESVDDSYLAQHGSWKRWFLGKTSIGLGYPKIGVRIHDWVPGNWYEMFPGYRHTAGWNGEEPEVRSTARYWTGNHTNNASLDFDGLVADLWHAVHVQFENSRLATFQEVYSGWVKRYNMGFGFVKMVNGRYKQITRNEVIQLMGGKWKFLEAWRRIFKDGLGVNMPAPVFAKYESLKAKKSLEKAVRTVVGSPFIHHVMTTVFNYHPNHNYKIWEVPMKVGMPMNGQNFNRLWEMMLRHEKVWAGDMTAFDSTQSPAIVRVCAAIRKQGYELHRDRNAICELIDISYEALLKQPLGFKNTGDIAWKAQGFTTGHSSTSVDNSNALVANYLHAWRRVTGLRAREFFNYNTLANFGDDHVLGYDEVFGWTPPRMIGAMAELGTIMRDEAPGETRMPDLSSDFNKLDFAFLAKQPVPLTTAVKAELARAGVSVPLTYATAHVKHRLIGKAKGEGLKGKLQDPVSSYQALLSYIFMTAHHHDVYRDLVRQAHIMYQNYSVHWRERGLIDRVGRSDRLKRPPSYNEVLRAWYSKEPFPYREEGAEPSEDEDVFYVHLQDDILGLIVRWVADLPTLLSPRYTNTRWSDWVQVKGSWALSWPISLVSMANKHEGNLRATRSDVAKTPYSFLRNEALVPSLAEPFGVLLTRHWCYLGFTRLLGRSRRISILDFVRLFDSGWASLVFIATAQVTTVAVDLDLHVRDTILILLLSYVKIDSGFGVCQYDLLSPSLIVARVVSTLLSFVTPSGSIDYQPLDEQFRHLLLDPGKSFILDAPTGVGKSTRMLNRLASQLPLGWSLVAIQPRHLVAVSVFKYMKALYPASSIGCQTEGHTLAGGETLIYTTGQSFMASKLSDRKNVVVVLDEAHIYEPIYVALRNYLNRSPAVRKIFVTATPTSSLTLYHPTVKVPAVSQFRVLRVDHEASSVRDFLTYVTGFVNDRLPFEKTLVFLPSIRLQHQFAESVSSRVCILNSKQTDLDPDASVFVATSVADAGLTIPDVTFVFSMDFDVAVTQPDSPPPQAWKQTGASAQEAADWVKRGSGATPYHFDLPAPTIGQRMGRTGRTSDGYFHLFRVDSVERSDQTFTKTDFINGCSPAATRCAPYFDSDLTKVDPYLFSALDYWQALPGGTYPRYLWIRKRFEGLMPAGTVEQFSRYIKNNWVSLIEMNHNWPLSLEPEDRPLADLSDGPMEVQPDEGFAPTSKDADAAFFLDGDNGLVTSEPDESEEEETSFGLPRVGLVGEPTRIDVSGAGLLCGVRALRGLIWSVSEARPTFDDVYANVLNHTAEDVVGPDMLRNFHALPLQYAAYYGFGVRVQVLFDDGTNTIPPHPDWVGGPLGTLYQSPNHYNYLGFKVPDS